MAKVTWPMQSTTLSPLLSTDVTAQWFLLRSKLTLPTNSSALSRVHLNTFLQQQMQVGLLGQAMGVDAYKVG